MIDFEEVVEACNLVTEQWFAALDCKQSQVASGVGVAILLATLLEVATDDACAELEDALMISQADAMDTANRLLELIEGKEEMAVGMGLWTHREVELRPEFARAVRATIDALPDDQSVLDRWVENRTKGMITRFPVEISEETRLLAASVLAVEGLWVERFTDDLGRWQGGKSWYEWLTKTSTDVEAADLLTRDDLVVSRVVCRTKADFDVHLVAGSETDPADQIMKLAIEALDGKVETVSATDLKVRRKGGCLRVVEEPSHKSGRYLRVSLPTFEIEATHDLLDHAALFGLVAAQDDSRGHFPKLSNYPLAVEGATQSAVAGFSAAGFVAAAATASAAMGAAEPEKKSQIVVDVTFDRPFGFVVVDRATGLVLFTGWVAEPSKPFGS